jgi:hypothetical protein
LVCLRSVVLVQQAALVRLVLLVAVLVLPVLLVWL